MIARISIVLKYPDMPIYEYICQDCRNPFEKLVFKSEQEQPVECPTCGSGKAQKQLSVFRARTSSGASSDSGGASAAAGCGCNPSGCGCR
jgi:putative FmdB family regulatory protein